MLRVLIAALISTAAMTPTAAFCDHIEPFAPTELNRVDPGKVLDLINRIKKSGGSIDLPAQ